MSRVRSVRVWGPSTGPTACALAGRRCSLWGWLKGVPGGGGAFHHCEGRLTSGAVPPPTARPLGGLLGSATHVLWARVCRCGGPTLSPWPACPVGAACRGAGGGLSPGGLPITIVRGVWCQALSLSQPPILWGGRPGFCDPCVPGAVSAGVGTEHRPHSVRPCGPALLAVGVAEGVHPAGGAFHHCEGRLVSGAVPPPAARPLERAARVPRPVCPGRGRCGCGDAAPAPQRAPFRAGVARCGGGGRASPGGVPSTIVRGVRGQALSLSRLPAHRAGCWGPPPTCCGSGCVVVGAQHCPLGLHALWGLRAAGLVGGRPRGAACHCCEGRLVSGAVPPPAVCPLERAARVPRPVCPGCGPCGCGDPAPAPQRVPLRAGVARCGGG